MTAAMPAAMTAAMTAALLVACATPPPLAPGEVPWTTGRMSVRIEATAEQPGQNASAAFELRGSGEAGELRLNSPLGTRLVGARWAPGLALLTTPEGERRYDNLDDLSRQALGEALPLVALPDWLAGRPWAGAVQRSTATGFEQLGWQVLLTRRAEGWIEARRDAPPVVLLRVRLDGDQP